MIRQRVPLFYQKYLSQRWLLGLIPLLCVLTHLHIARGEAELNMATDAHGIMLRNCIECHSTKIPQAGLDVMKLAREDSIVTDEDEWSLILRRVKAREMPPAYATQQISEDERNALVEWIENSLQEAACGDGIEPGPPVLRRLNQNEYAATVRDLLNVQFNAGSNLPADGAGGAGFDNAGETLFISPIHAERYLEAAREALEYAAKEARSREAIFIAQPDDETCDRCAAYQVLERFASKAFRRPVATSEMKPLMRLFEMASEREEPFEDAVFYAMQAVMISPNFLFLVEQPNTEDQMRPIGDYELASRLSYFLWSSMPDEELLEIAAEGRLHDECILEEQVNRMLDEPKFELRRRRRAVALEDRKFHEFAVSFVSQWLGTRELGRNIKPSYELFPRMNADMESAMRYEPIFVFQEILVKDLSLLSFIDSDFSYMNRQLTRHYNLHEQVKVENSQLERVDLPEGSNRGGVMTMAGVLAVSSFPHRTSPVLRGKWVLETLLGTPPPPPPPDIPELPEEHDAVEPQSLRERLMIHRQNPVCASCHDSIDPIGFGLENFDPIGQWRDEDANKPIDASGVLPNGSTFNGPSELKEVLLERKDDFIRHLTIKMLSYALGRGLIREDYCTVDQIVQTLKENDYRARVLVWEIVKSVPFRYHPANQATKIAVESGAE